jgi:hypothetical protein
MDLVIAAKAEEHGLLRHGGGLCAAMGAAAAHALDLAGSGSTHDVDLDRLHERLAPNRE